jgi:Holliday junction resolvasome RuvABC endonuclease subunit
VLVLGIDAATRTGFAIGESGGKPRTGAVRLKKPSDPLQVAWCNAGFFLRDLFVLDRPDLLALEAPLPAAAQRSSAASELQWGVVAVITFMAAAYGIRIEYVNAQTVSRHFTGKARWTAAEGGRKAKKEAAVQRAQLLGYVSKQSFDEDVADAIAVWDYACAMWAKAPPPRALHMFGEAAR